MLSQKRKENQKQKLLQKASQIVYELKLFLRKMNHLLVLIPTPSQLSQQSFHLKLSNLKKHLTIITLITYQMKIIHDIRMFLLMESQKKIDLNRLTKNLAENLANPLVLKGKRYCFGCIMI